VRANERAITAGNSNMEVDINTPTVLTATNAEKESKTKKAKDIMPTLAFITLAKSLFNNTSSIRLLNKYTNPIEITQIGNNIFNSSIDAYKGSPKSRLFTFMSVGNK
jgi:hypothetical protein